MRHIPGSESYPKETERFPPGAFSKNERPKEWHFSLTTTQGHVPGIREERCKYSLQRYSCRSNLSLRNREKYESSATSNLSTVVSPPTKPTTPFTPAGKGAKIFRYHDVGPGQYRTPFNSLRKKREPLHSGIQAIREMTPTETNNLRLLVHQGLL